MSLLLDTNALSEFTHDRPNPGYFAWFMNADEDEFHLSALTIAELRRGVLRLGEGEKRRKLATFVDRTLEFYGDRILPVDVRVAESWAQLAHDYRRTGVLVGAVDEMIAATALAHDLTLVTRNTRHFEASGCRLFSPWTP